MITSPVVKIISFKTLEAFFAISGKIIILKSTSKSSEISICVDHPEAKNWSSVAALSDDEKLFAVCDCEKNLFIYEIIIDNNSNVSFNPLSVPMHLAKTATSVKFTNFPVNPTILVADKFGDVLRFQVGAEFDRWAQESRKNSKTLSIHTKKQNKRGASEIISDETDDLAHDSKALEESETQTQDESEAHHCTIIGHISMITDLQVLPIKGTLGGLIITADRDEKVRLTRADFPERIHSFGLIHREFVGSLAVCQATQTFFSAGGDKFIAEWCLQKINSDSSNSSDGVDLENFKLVLKSKINLESNGVVQELKVNKKGNCLIAHIDAFGIVRFEKEIDCDEWKLSETIQNSELTAFDFDSNSEDTKIITASWSITNGVSFNLDCGPSLNILDQITPENGQEILALLSKSKLRKDVERMDWKQKKHSNQKPKNISE